MEPAMSVSLLDDGTKEKSPNVSCKKTGFIPYLPDIGSARAQGRFLAEICIYRYGKRSVSNFVPDTPKSGILSLAIVPSVTSVREFSLRSPFWVSRMRL